MDIIYNEDKLPFDGGKNNRKGVGIQYRVIEDLESEPIDVDFFKAHARIDNHYDDALCESYIRAARQELEKWSQLSFGKKKIQLMALELPNNFELMHGPVSKVEAYKNLGNIVLDSKGKNVTLTFETDWGVLPEAIKIAVARHAASLYMLREGIIIDDRGRTQKAVENEAKEMLRPYMKITML